MTRDESIDFAYVVRWLWLHRLALAIGGVLGLAAAIVWGLNAREIFRAEVVVAEANVGGLGAGSLMNQLGGIAGLAGINIGVGETGRQDRALLRSRRLAEEFIVRNKLLPVLFPTPGENATLWFAVRRFKAQMVNVREDTRTELITVTMSAGDPDKAAEWANAYVALANELARTKAIDEASRNIAYLRTEIGKTEVAELQRVLYQLVESESKTLMLASARPQYAFTVIDPAVRPGMRDSPRRTVMALMGTFAGLLLGVAFVMARTLFARARLANRQSRD